MEESYLEALPESDSVLLYEIAVPFCRHSTPKCRRCFSKGRLHLLQWKVIVKPRTRRSLECVEENLLEVEDTCIMLHAVLKASGHVDRFNDFMVKAGATSRVCGIPLRNVYALHAASEDVMDESKFFRADKLLEEVMERELENPAISEERIISCSETQIDKF
eukprot:4632423-Amphidinium_carterae.3